MLQQYRGFVVVAQPHGELGQHAQRRHVEGLLGQARTQACFRNGQIALRQCIRTGHQLGVLGTDGNMLETGRIGAILITSGMTQIGQRQPRPRQAGLQRDGALECGYGGRTMAGTDAGTRKLQPGPGRPRLRPRERFEDLFRLCKCTLRNVCHAQHQLGTGVARHGNQHLPGLLDRQRRLRLQKSQRMRQGCIHATNGCRLAHCRHAALDAANDWAAHHRSQALPDHNTAMIS